MSKEHAEVDTKHVTRDSSRRPGCRSSSELTPLAEHWALSTPQVPAQTKEPKTRTHGDGADKAAATRVKMNRRSLKALFEADGGAEETTVTKDSTTSTPPPVAVRLAPIPRVRRTGAVLFDALCAGDSTPTTRTADPDDDKENESPRENATDRPSPEFTSPRLRRGIASQKKRASPQDVDGQDALHSNAQTSTGPAQTSLEAPACSESGNGDDCFVIRKKWKRGLAASANRSNIVATDRSTAAASPGPPPLRLQRPPPAPPSLGRSMSSPSLRARPPVNLEPHQVVLPTTHSRDHPDLNVITPQTVADLLDGAYDEQLASYTFIDCRFEYEHVGGSLKGSIWMNDPAVMEEQLLRNPSAISTRTALVFFCEFSANRAPKMLRHLRNLDRSIHAERYPELYYPELYLIDGGYKNCFESLKIKLCEPQTYVRMSDDAYVSLCKTEFTAWRRRWRSHKTSECAARLQDQQLQKRYAQCAAHTTSDDCLHVDDAPPRPANLRSLSELH